MPDKEDAPSVRYPNTAEDTAVIRGQLHAALDRVYTQHGISELVLCLGSAGTDLLAVEWALQKQQETGRKISLALYLPFNKTVFRNWSVAYGEEIFDPVSGKKMKDYWGDLFDGVSQYVHEPQLRGVINRLKRGLRIITSPTRDEAIAESKRRNNGESSQHYADVNSLITGMLRKNDFVVAVWDGKGGRKPGGTRDALIEAAGRINHTEENQHMYILQPYKITRGIRFGLHNIQEPPPTFEQLREEYNQKHRVRRRLGKRI